MARTCEHCGRGAMKSATRSHSNIMTLRRRQLNLQSAVVDGKRKTVCTSCLRTIRRPKA